MKKYIYAMCVMMLLNSCVFEEMENKRIWSHMKDYIGQYQLNIKKSDLGAYETDTSLYKDLVLTIMADTSYECSKDVPFLMQRSGKWTMDGDDMSQYCIFLYKDGSYDQLVLDTNDAVYIHYPIGNPYKKGVNYVYFDRMK